MGGGKKSKKVKCADYLFAFQEGEMALGAVIIITEIKCVHYNYPGTDFENVQLAEAILLYSYFNWPESYFTGKSMLQGDLLCLLPEQTEMGITSLLYVCPSVCPSHWSCLTLAGDTCILWTLVTFSGSFNFFYYIFLWSSS